MLLYDLIFTTNKSTHKYKEKTAEKKRTASAIALSLSLDGTQRRIITAAHYSCLASSFPLHYSSQLL